MCFYSNMLDVPHLRIGIVFVREQTKLLFLRIKKCVIQRSTVSCHNKGQIFQTLYEVLQEIIFLTWGENFTRV